MNHRVITQSAAQTFDHGIPPGWDHNPSALRYRLPLLALAVIGLAIAGYLTLYQLRVLKTVWEPFFGNGSQVILNSSVAHFLPVPDASLGILGYLADIVLGILGGSKRWRTTPWLVLLFGLNVAVLGVGSLVLVLLQGTVFHAWCALCLASAVISITIAAVAQDEVRAALRRLLGQGSTGEMLIGVTGQQKTTEPRNTRSKS